MANLFELQTKYTTVYDYVRNSGWFGKAGNDMDYGYCTSTALAKVKDVLVNGNRTLPLWVNEHDCFSDLVYASNNGKTNKNGNSNPTPVTPIPTSNTATPPPSSQGWKAIGTATSSVNDLNVRKTPNGAILRTLNKGNRFEVDGQKSGKWIHVNVAGTIGYIYEDYVIYD